MRETKAALQIVIREKDREIRQLENARDIYEDVSNKFDKMYDGKVKEVKDIEEKLARKGGEYQRMSTAIEKLLAELNILREERGLKVKTHEDIFPERFSRFNGNSMVMY